VPAGAWMLEPQSTALFILLMVSFGALLWWLLAARQPVFRVLAACLAFIPAAAFGVAAAGVMSGYFAPFDNQLENPLRRVSPFGGSADCGRRTRPGRRSGSCARAPSFPCSG
jgi:pimeloyl-ACP methyl ester carboxylesterase